MHLQKILIIQTAFLGDVVLATGLAEKLKFFYPEAELHFLLRKGNEGVLKDHPHLHKVWVLDKQKKASSLFNIIQGLRKEKFDLVVNAQRFMTSGLITVLSGAKKTIGFDKNPMSMFFSERYPHVITPNGRVHEIGRNNQLIEHITNDTPSKPKLYPSNEDFEKVSEYSKEPYLTVAPASVWFTKQWPKEKWIEFIDQVKDYNIYLLGAPSDHSLCEEIKSSSTNERVVDLSGKLSPLQSAALMKNARMNYVNDSAPMHFASALNAPVRAVYCSTVPEFGFGPLSDNSDVIETKGLDCRPCGLHGHRECPQGHFKCASNIEITTLLKALK